MTAHDVSYSDPTSSTVELRVEWSQRLGYFAVAAAVFMAVIAGGAIFSVVDAVRQGDLLMAAGSTAFALMMTIMTGIGIRLAGFRWVRLSSRISAVATEHGVGLCVPKGRTTPVLVTALACCAVLGIGGCVIWALDVGGSALSESDN